jgi:hypothetical protein
MNVIYYDLYQSTRLEKFITGIYTGLLTLGSQEVIEKVAFDLTLFGRMTTD